MKLGERFDEDILDGILRVLLAAEHPAAIYVDLFFVRFNDRLETIHLTGLNAPHALLYRIQFEDAPPRKSYFRLYNTSSAKKGTPVT